MICLFKSIFIMSCNGNVYNIGMGCCELVLGPVENYYTKPTIDRKLEEITSAITSGCCITPEEVDEKIEEAISGITVSGVTEEQLNEAIDSAKTEIEAEIPSLDGYASEQWVLDQHYITGVDLSNYATLQDIPTVPTKVSAFENDVPYLTEHSHCLDMPPQPLLAHIPMTSPPSMRKWLREALLTLLSTIIRLQLMRCLMRSWTLQHTPQLICQIITPRQRWITRLYQQLQMLRLRFQQFQQVTQLLPTMLVT